MKQMAMIVILLALLVACAPQQTTDLYSSAYANQATADAARALAEMQTGMLTATSQAPVMHITETAAALTVGMTQSSINATATAIHWTPTVTATATPDFTATVGAAQASANSTQMANAAALDDLGRERAEIINVFVAQLPRLAFLVALGVLAMGLTWISRRERYRPLTVDQRGNPIPVMDVVDGVVTDIDRSPNYQGAMSHNMLAQWARRRLGLPAQLPAITAERQDGVTQRDQMVDLATRGLLPSGNAPARKQLAGQAMMAYKPPTPRAAIEYREDGDVQNWVDEVETKLNRE